MTNLYGVYICWRHGIARISFLLYVAFSSDHAYQWLEERKLPMSKKQGGFVKKLGRSPIVRDSVLDEPGGLG